MERSRRDVASIYSIASRTQAEFHVVDDTLLSRTASKLSKCQDKQQAATLMCCYTKTTRQMTLGTYETLQEAAKLFKLFKRQIEATDLALSKKDEATADRLLQGASTSYSSWLQVVGISV